MSDNLRQYRAIRDALTHGYPGEPTGRLAQHLATLAAFIRGVIAPFPETYAAFLLC